MKDDNACNQQQHSIAGKKIVTKNQVEGQAGKGTQPYIGWLLLFLKFGRIGYLFILHAGKGIIFRKVGMCREIVHEIKLVKIELPENGGAMPALPFIKRKIKG